MRYLMLLLIFILTSCEDSNKFIHSEAKRVAPDSEVCYSVTEPADIVGYYCLRYVREQR